MSKVISVRFQASARVYSFLPGDETDLVPGDYVVVNTTWGRQIGQVVHIRDAPSQERDDLKPVLRRATGADLALYHQLQEKAQSALKKAAELAAESGIKAKFASAEYTLDGKRLTILYESESKERLNEIRGRLRSQMHTRVELRAIGARDRARLLGGYGACGEPRCCSRFLCEFSPISIRMAKAQGVSLSPSEITGMCDRLRCCLGYEHQTYKKALEGMPKRKALVETPYGRGKVIDLLPLRGTVVVQIEGQRIQVPANEVRVIPKQPSHPVT